MKFQCFCSGAYDLILLCKAHRKAWKVNGLAEVQFRAVSVYIQNLGGLWTPLGLRDARKYPFAVFCDSSFGP